MFANRSAVSAQTFPQQDIKGSTVFDLVYRYLQKCADRDRKWKRRDCACNKFYKQHARKRNIHEQAPMFGTNFKDKIDEQFKPKFNKFELCKRISRTSSKEYIVEYTKAVRDGIYTYKFLINKYNLYKNI